MLAARPDRQAPELFPDQPNKLADSIRVGACVNGQNPDPWITILAGSKKDNTAITVRDYSDMICAKDRARIAKLIRLRFSERYLDPVLHNPKPHGFSILAIGCLMVEALESFRNGWKKTSGCPGGGAAVFSRFFQAHDEFKDLRPVAQEFYEHVRCGILHQAETTGNWRVHRNAGLFSQSGGVRRLSASEFGKRLRVVLNGYTDGLAKADWKDPAWKKARKKLRAICRNCGLPDADVAKLQ